MIKVLALDISTKTGFAVGTIEGQQLVLVEWGAVKKIDKPDSPYPKDYLEWSRAVRDELVKIIDAHRPDIIVIEETSRGSKNAMSQKILEYIHYLVASHIVSENYNTKYYMTGEWRNIVGAKMTSAELKKNAQSRKIKLKTGAKLARDENNKIIGKVTKKHVNVRKANEIFNLDLKVKDNDLADALLLLKAYHIEFQK